MGTRINGKDDVAAIKLSTGNQIERRGKHSHPRSYRGGMQIELAGIHVRCRGLATECGKNHLSQFENQGKPNNWALAVSPVSGLHKSKEKKSTGMATTNPAMGPAMPISNRSRRLRMGERMRMNAPRVPIKVGAGMKNGQVANTFRRTHKT